MDNPAKKISPYRDIFEEFVDNANFLWVLRNRQLTQPHVYRDNIDELDSRIQANLDGILVSLADAWDIIVENSQQFAQGGEAFVMAATAFRVEDPQKIQQATEFGLSNEHTFKGLVSALAWLPGTQVHPWIKQFFASKNLDHKHIAIAACRVRKEDPAQYLNLIMGREDCRAHLPLYAGCLRIIGELKRTDLVEDLAIASNHEDTTVKFWAIWSSLRLDRREQAELLKPYVFDDNPLRHKALTIAFRNLPLMTARSWIGELAQNPASQRIAIKACGLLSDPLAIEWLLSHMETPEFARVAAESFYLISGLSLSQPQLQIEAPAVTDAILDADEKQLEELSEDENLPWPHKMNIQTYWANNSTNHNRNWLTEIQPAQLSCRYQPLQDFPINR